MGKELTELDNLIGKEPIILYVFMNGCPACIRIDPIWEEAKKKVNSSVKMLKIEIRELQTSTKFPKSYMPTKFPTILKIFSATNIKSLAYDKMQVSNGLVEWINNGHSGGGSPRKTVRQRHSKKKQLSVAEISGKFCRCISKLTKSKNKKWKNAAFAICTKSVINNRGYERTGTIRCKGKAAVSMRKVK